MTPMEKRGEKLADKELKSASKKKMTNKEFTKFCAEVQAAGVSASAMPKMNPKVDLAS